MNNLSFVKVGLEAREGPLLVSVCGEAGEVSGVPGASIPITTKRLQIQPILRLFVMVTQKQPSREAIVQRD